METNNQIPLTNNNVNPVKKTRIKIPRKVKVILACVIVVIVFILGITFSKVLNHNETVLDFGFNDVGELVTQEWYGRILEDSSKDRKAFKKISIPFTTSRIIFSLDVEVLAGIDFKEIEYEISADQSKIEVTLPKAQIYKYYQVPKTFKSYLDDESIFTNIDSTEKHKLEDAVVEKGKKQALEAGLLEKADNNAKVIVEQMIRAKNKNIKIEWK